MLASTTSKYVWPSPGWSRAEWEIENEGPAASQSVPSPVLRNGLAWDDRWVHKQVCSGLAPAASQTPLTFPTFILRNVECSSVRQFYTSPPPPPSLPSNICWPTGWLDDAICRNKSFDFTNKMCTPRFMFSHFMLNWELCGTQSILKIILRVLKKSWIIMRIIVGIMAWREENLDILSL